MIYRWTLAAILALASGGALAAPQTGMADPGHRIAVETCGACHQVDGGPMSNRSGPAFSAISRMPSTTELSLKVFLKSSHRNMPNFILPADEIDDVVAYILGLASK